MNDKLAAELLLTMKRLITILEGFTPQAVSNSSDNDDDWASASDAYEALKSSRVKSPAALKRLRLEGVLSESRGEVRNISKGDTPRWEYNVPKCREAIKSYFARLSA